MTFSARTEIARLFDLDLKPEKFLLYTTDQRVKLGRYEYNDGFRTNIPTGIFRIVDITYEFNTHYVYGELVIPCNISACKMVLICSELNNPVQCEHEWHSGPDRSYDQIKQA